MGLGRSYLPHPFPNFKLVLGFEGVVTPCEYVLLGPVGPITKVNCLLLKVINVNYCVLCLLSSSWCDFKSNNLLLILLYVNSSVL